MAGSAARAAPGMAGTLALVAVGGAAGATLRYTSGVLWPHDASGFPTGDFVSNLLGCLLMGYFLGAVSLLPSPPAHRTPLIATGFLGGLTTFSSYAADAAQLVDVGEVTGALVYLVATVGFGWLLLRGSWEWGRRSLLPGLGRGLTARVSAGLGPLGGDRNRTGGDR